MAPAELGQTRIKKISEWVGSPWPLIIAGPCSAESELQVLETARQLKSLNRIHIFRAGVWKPRTRPGGFEGLGEVALPWVKKVKEELGFSTVVEIANARHIDLVLKNGIDMIWLGARTTANPFSVQEIADALEGVDIPVFIKNPISPDLALWLGAIERVSQAGVNKIIAVHRGFASVEVTKYRNRPFWRLPIELRRRLPELPMLCDPSHIAGKRNLVAEVSQKALDSQFDGLMIESHYQPERALSDASQQVTPQQLGEILDSLILPHQSTEPNFHGELEKLRELIDELDAEIINKLAKRMELVDEIAEAKFQNNDFAFQPRRMEQLLEARKFLGKRLGLSEGYIQDIYSLIHGESVKRQTEYKINKTKPNESETLPPELS